MSSTYFSKSVSWKQFIRRAKQKTHHELIHTATLEKITHWEQKAPVDPLFQHRTPGRHENNQKTWAHPPLLRKWKELFPEPPLLAHRRAPNLSNLLVRATLPYMHPKPRLAPCTCDTDNCPDCQIIKSRTQIANKKRNTFQLAPNTYCQTENVIYALFCKVC